MLAEVGLCGSRGGRIRNLTDTTLDFLSLTSLLFQLPWKQPALHGLQLTSHRLKRTGPYFMNALTVSCVFPQDFPVNTLWELYIPLGELLTNEKQKLTDKFFSFLRCWGFYF